MLIPFWYSRREKVEWFVTAFTCFAIAALLPSPQHVNVNGQDVVIVKINGWEPPEWALFLIGATGICAVYGLVKLIGNKIWPLPKAEAGPAFQKTAEDVEKWHQGNNMSVGWIPEVPGTPSPMEYVPWVPTPESKAEEFLAASGPSPMRVMILGQDEWMRENQEFQEASDRWMLITPESELRRLLTLVEADVSAKGEVPGDDLYWMLVRANELRKVPSAEEIRALADRVGCSEDVREYLPEMGD